MSSIEFPSGQSILRSIGINPATLHTDFPDCEQRIQYRAVVNWLADYAPRWTQRKGLEEAYYHLCEAGNQEAANKIQALLGN